MKHDYTTLLHFLNTGELGQLKMGMSEDDIFAYLGEPDRYGEKSRPEAGVVTLFYGCMLLIIVSGILTRCEVRGDWFPEYSLPAELDNGWFAEFCSWDEKDLILLLEREQIKYYYSLKNRNIQMRQICTRIELPPESPAYILIYRC
ncbi:MAG: hypothetical protein ACPG7F_17670 [Aggregatilineales bacterium]